MALNNNIGPGLPPLIWDNLRQAFDVVNQNFTEISATLAGGTIRNIINVDGSNPVKITTLEAHGLVNGQEVSITKTGISQIDGLTFYASVIDNTELLLYSDASLTTTINGSAYDAYPSSGGFLQPLSTFSTLDFDALSTDVIPNLPDEYDLGSNLRRWQSLYISEFTEAPGDEFNGIWIADAHIKGLGSIVDLPENSTVNGVLINDPSITFFSSVDVDGNLSIPANIKSDVLNLTSGTAIQLVVDSASESITFNNTGVTSLSAGTGINVSSNTGSVNITNTGVTSIANSTGLPAGRVIGSGIHRNSSTGGVTLTNTGILQVQGGFGITVSTDAATGIATVANSQPAQPAFRTFQIDGDIFSNAIVADGTADTFTLIEGYGINLTSDPLNDSLTIEFLQNVDIIGSVFADNSTLLVDAVEGKIVGPVESDVLGDLTGNVKSALNPAITILDTSAPIAQLLGDVIGNITGYHTGDMTGSVFADDSTKLVDAVESKVVGNVDTNLIETTVITSQGGNLNATGATLIVGAANGTAQGGPTLVGGGVGTAGNGGSASLFGGPGSAGNGGDVFVSGGNGSAGDGGDASMSAGTGSVNGGKAYINGGTGSAGNGGGVSIIGGNGSVTDGIIDIGITNTSQVNIENAVIQGDLTGSLFSQDSSLLINGIDGKIVGPIESPSIVGDLVGSVFADDSTVLVNSVDGTLAYNATTPGDWNGTPPSTVGEALDRIAAWITANGGAGSP